MLCIDKSPSSDTQTKVRMICFPMLEHFEYSSHSLKMYSCFVVYISVYKIDLYTICIQAHNKAYTWPQ